VPAERYYIDQALAISSLHSLKGNEFHHMARVMRSKAGDIVELVNGKGQLALAGIEAMQKEQALLRIDELTEESPGRQLLILAQALPKPDRLAFILEKGTELGVDAFWLFPGQLSHQKQIFPHQTERAHALLVAAMKQCGRLFLPSLELKGPLKEWPQPSGRLLFGDLDPAAPWLGSQQAALPLGSQPVIFFTGPESGWSIDETALLKKMGSKGVRLNEHILRTDTASIAALAMISLMQHNSLIDKRPFGIEGN